MLEDLIRGMEQRHIAKPVSSEAFHKWKNNGVTKRLMDELELQLVDCLMADAVLDNNENMARSAAIRQATKENVEAILNWKPQELVEDDD